MSDTLRERVAKQVCCEYPCQHPFDCFSHNHLVAADAAIALVLEEAAKEAECVVAYSTSQAVMRENIAAAIRALKVSSPSK